MSNDQLHNTAGANLSVSDVSLDVAGVDASLPLPITINGSGFGAGPNVVLFDSFSSNSHETPIIHSGSEIGSWYGDNLQGFGMQSGTEAYEYGNRKWMATRKAAVVDTDSLNPNGLEYRHGEDFTEFRFAFRMVVPTGKKLVGTTEPNTTNNSSSNWKMTWFGKINEGYAVGTSGGQPDLCIPSNNGPSTVTVGGNTLRPKFYDVDPVDGNSLTTFIHGSDEQIYSYYQKPETSNRGKDGSLEFLRLSPNSINRRFSTNATAWYSDRATTVATKGFDVFFLNGWMGNGTPQGHVGVLPLMTDAYLAVGPNSQACLIVSDAATLAGSTHHAIIPPDSWTDTEITATLKPHENGLRFNHLILADGTLRENV